MNHSKVVLSLLLLATWTGTQQAQVAPAKQRSASEQPIANSSNGLAQKPPVNTSVFDKWPWVGSPALSNDGNYAIYTIKNLPRSRSGTLVVRGIKSKWNKEIEIIGDAAITQDSRTAVFLKPDNSLCLLTLGTSATGCIPTVASFKLGRQRADEWLVYQLNNPTKELIARNLGTGRHQSFGAVTEYMFSGDGSTLLLQTEAGNGGATTSSLSLVNLLDGKVRTIWRGAKANNFVFDDSNTQLAFTAEEQANDSISHSLWYYKLGTDKALLLTDRHHPSLDAGVRLESIQRFSHDGSRLFVTLKQLDLTKPKPDAVNVDVWSYTDPVLQSKQLKNLSRESYAAVIHIANRQLIRLQQENESMSFMEGSKDDIALIAHYKGDFAERKWNPAFDRSYYLVSTKNAERKQLKMHPAFVEGPGTELSPEGKYLICADDTQTNLFSYEVETEVTRNITQALPIPLTDNEYDGVQMPPPRGLFIAAWLNNEAAVLIYDKYDIWQVDPASKKPPVNVTNGYGRAHNIVFRLAKIDSDRRTVFDNEKLILTALNRTTKENGFYSKALDENGDPELLTMGPYRYSIPTQRTALSLVEGQKRETYLVQRESASESPNYFWTSDFKQFSVLSNVYPEKDYNWLTTELVTWRTFDGRSAQGILYKPENFDPKQKYPVIIHYYERLSDKLHHYTRPTATTDSINIPWFVSRGYLVFLPDIHYAVGEPGQSVYGSIVSGAKYLTTFPWVDSTKMGIQGHSFGGFETNYLVTHTNIFAAAASSAGVSNLVSGYGEVMLSSGSPHGREWAETGQGRLGATLWQRPDLYIKNSPIFKADNVTTPLLIMHNKGDGIVNFSQGVEFFTALRRLGKKAWMLQYDGAAHSFSALHIGSKKNDAATKDYTIRLTQFFDHYLKGEPPPKWMTEGIPAKRKGLDLALELDTSGTKP